MLEFKQKPCNCKENALNHCKEYHNLFVPISPPTLPYSQILNAKKASCEWLGYRACTISFLRQAPVTCRAEVNLKELFQFRCKVTINK